jgi:hypothetical protein
MGEFFAVAQQPPLEPNDELANTTNGMIFEFKDIEQAKDFAAEVLQRYKLAGRVFDNVEDAERAHLSPFLQTPPVVHIDRPYWTVPDWLPPGMWRRIWDIAWKIEPKIEKLAKRFGGKFIGN